MIKQIHTFRILTLAQIRVNEITHLRLQQRNLKKKKKKNNHELQQNNGLPLITMGIISKLFSIENVYADMSKMVIQYSHQSHTGIITISS